MANVKENSKAAFNQQAATYDSDIKGQHARSLYPVMLKKLSDVYKRQVKLAKEIGGDKAAKELGIPKGTIHTWLKAVRTRCV